MRCSYCGSTKHSLTNCPRTRTGNERRSYNLRCGYCGQGGHTIKACKQTASGNAARAWNPGSVENEFVDDWGEFSCDR